jgi:hypothetical protein
MSIEDIAKEIIENIINFYKKNPSKSEINRFVKEQLKNYSEKVKKIVEKELVDILGDFYYTNDDPQIAITPLKLSEMLYKRANILAKEVSKILIDGIKAKETVREIAMKLYEGYGFKDKEVLEAVKVLPKYLQEAIKKRDKEIMKQIEKLKTKPLRIAYKDIIRRLEKLSDEELRKYIKVAYHEKMRYYAKRIADTETHRAAMSKRAREYLNDKNIEFVRFEMSAAHPKIDICDFYANLDIGYGRGIVPKSEMRTLPLHPHCHCVYSPYYGKVKGRRKSWNKAVKDTMNKFNEAQQKEILGTYDMLNRFKGGEDIERIFNTIRPKYPIRKYEELFGKIPLKNGAALDIANMLKELETKKLTKTKIIVGRLDKKIVDFLETKNVKIHTKEIYLTSKGLSHLTRDSKQKRGAGLIKDDVLKIPDILENPDAIFFDKHNNRFNLIYCKTDKKVIKLVIDTKGFEKRKTPITLIKTAGYIQKSDMKNPFFELIIGKWKFK